MVNGAQADGESELRAKRSRARRASNGPEKPARGMSSLHGIWAGRFPEDFDVDKELREIRSARRKRLDELDA